MAKKSAFFRRNLVGEIRFLKYTPLTIEAWLPVCMTFILDLSQHFSAFLTSASFSRRDLHHQMMKRLTKGHGETRTSSELLLQPLTPNSHSLTSLIIVIIPLFFPLFNLFFTTPPPLHFSQPVCVCSYS